MDLESFFAFFAGVTFESDIIPFDLLQSGFVADFIRILWRWLHFLYQFAIIVATPTCELELSLNNQCQTTIFYGQLLLFRIRSLYGNLWFFPPKFRIWSRQINIGRLKMLLHKSYLWRGKSQVSKKFGFSNIISIAWISEHPNFRKIGLKLIFFQNFRHKWLFCIKNDRKIHFFLVYDQAKRIFFRQDSLRHWIRSNKFMSLVSHIGFFWVTHRRTL